MVNRRKQQPKKPQYKGILNEPILCRSFFHPAEERSAIILAERIKKLIALCDHFDIEKDDTMFVNLALALATEHVPGFTVIDEPKKTAGKPDEFTGGGLKGFLLYALVKKYRQENNCSLVAAIQSIIKNESEFSKDSAKSLRIRYYEITKSFPKGNLLLNVLQGCTENMKLTPDQLDETIVAQIPLLKDILQWSTSKRIK